MEILATLAGHSLTVATKLFESNFLIETLVSILPSPGKPVSEEAKPEEFSFRILETLARNGNHLARKIFETKGVESSLVFTLLGPENRKIQPIASIFFSTLLRLGIGENLAFKMMPKFIENFHSFGNIIAAYFEIAENSSENLQKLRSVVKSCPKSSRIFVPLVTLLARKALVLSKEAAFIEIGSLLPNLSDTEVDQIFGSIIPALANKTQMNMDSSPLPALVVEIDQNVKNAFDVAGEWLSLIGILMQLDRMEAVALISKLKPIFKSYDLIPSLVLCLESESILVGLTQIGKNLGNMVGLIPDSEIALLHAASFRSSLLLPFQESSISLDMKSSPNEGVK